MENLTFGIISDLHLSEEETGGDRHTKAALTLFAEKNADAVVVCGDVANTGRPAQYQKFLAIWEQVFSSCRKRPRLFAILGNHEFEQVYHGRQSVEEVYALYQKMYGYDGVNRHEKIGGYHFIGLCSEGSPVDGRYTEKTTGFLKKALDEAVADTKDAPIFVTAHQSLPHTTYGSHWGATATAPLFAVLKDYPQAVYFGGHSHAPCETERSIWQGAFTAVDVSSLQYVIVNGLHDEDLYQAQGFLFAEVTDASLTLRRYHCSDQGVRETRPPFFLPLPLDRNTFPYTDRRKEQRSAPAFPEHAAITPTGVSDQSIRLSFPAAAHEDFVLGYDVTVAEREEAPAFSGFFSSDFFLDWQKMRPTVTCKVKGLLPNRNYEVQVRAVEDFGKKSAPITCVFQTKGAAPSPDALASADCLDLWLPGGKHDHSSSRLLLRQQKDLLCYEASNGIFHRLGQQGFTLSLSLAGKLADGLLFAAGKKSLALFCKEDSLRLTAGGKELLTCPAPAALQHLLLSFDGQTLTLHQNGVQTAAHLCGPLFFAEKTPSFAVQPLLLQAVSLSYGPTDEQDIPLIFARSRQQEILQTLFSCRALLQKALRLSLTDAQKQEAFACSLHISALLEEAAPKKEACQRLLSAAQALSARLKQQYPALSWEEETILCTDLQTVFARSASWQQDRNDKIGRKFYTKNQNTAEFLVWKAEREIQSFSLRLMLLYGQKHPQWVQLALSEDGESWQPVPVHFGDPLPDDRYEEGEAPLWFHAALTPDGPIPKGCFFLRMDFSVFEGHAPYALGAEQVTFFARPKA